MIKIIDGDLLNATEDIICHQVNCQGVMGSGVARQVKEKYPEVFESYKKACKEISCLLGGVLYVSIKNKQQSIANLFAQDSYGKQGLYTDYIALQSCLNDLKHTTTGSIAFPYLMSYLPWRW